MHSIVRNVENSSSNNFSFIIYMEPYVTLSPEVIKFRHQPFPLKSSKSIVSPELQQHLDLLYF